MSETPIGGDSFPAGVEILEVHVAELRQLFNAIDPAPIRERDLDPRIEEFIVDWGRELPRDMPPALLVRLAQPDDAPEVVGLVRDAVHGFFTGRAIAARRRLRRLFQSGRTSLAIGFAVLVLFTIAAQLIGGRSNVEGFGRVLQESLAIGGWVAMWRPLQIFLYDWWPIRADARVFERLAAMPVRVTTGAQVHTSR